MPAARFRGLHRFFMKLCLFTTLAVFTSNRDLASRCVASDLPPPSSSSKGVASLPTAEQVAMLRERFEAEREQAREADRVTADELASRAALAWKANDLPRAARWYRAARVALPRDRSAPLPHLALTLNAVELGMSHADRVNGLVFTPDGKQLISASRDGTVVIWDVENERRLLSYNEHRGTTDAADVFLVASVAVSPDGEIVASSGAKDIHLWKRATGERLQTLSGHSTAARALAFTPDGTRLISGGDDRMVIAWEVATGKQLLRWPNQNGRVEGISIQAEGKAFATVNSAGELMIFPLDDAKAKVGKPHIFQQNVIDSGDAAYAVSYLADRYDLLVCGGDGKIRSINGPEPGRAKPVATNNRVYPAGGKLYALSATPDGKRFVAVGTEPILRLWNTETGKLLRSIPIRSNAQPGENREMGLSAVAISPQGDWLAVGTIEGLIQIHPADLDDDSHILYTAPDTLWAAAIDPTGRVAAVAGAGKTIQLIQLDTGETIKTLSGHTGAVTALLFLDANTLASTSGDKTVKLWNTNTGTATDAVGHQSAVIALAAAPDAPNSAKLLTGSADRTVRLWNTKGEELAQWDAKSAVAALALADDARFALVGTTNGLLTLLNLTEKTPKPVASLQAHGSGVAALSLAPGNRKLLSVGGDGQAKLWEIEPEANPRVLTRFAPFTTAEQPAKPLSAAVLTPDAKFALVAGADQLVHVWNLEANYEEKTFHGAKDWLAALAFTPVAGGKVLAVGVDRTARRFDLALSTAEAKNAGHYGPIAAVALSPNGTQLATAGADRLIKLWDAATGNLKATFVGTPGTLTGLGFLTEERLVSTADDGRLRFWSIPEQRETKSIPTGEAPLLLVVNPASKQIGLAATTTSGNEPAAVFQLYDENGKKLSETREQGRRLACLALSPSLNLGLTGAVDGSLNLWNLQTSEALAGTWPIFTQSLADASISADGSIVVALDREGNRALGNVEKRSTKKLPDVKEPQSLALAPDGQHHAVLTTEQELIYFNTNGEELRRWKLPAKPTTLAFHPNGKQLLAGLANGSALLLKLPE